MRIGTHHSRETKEKMSKGHAGEKHHFYGKHLSEEHRRRISEAEKGKIISLEHRKILSESRIGISLSEERKRKLSEFHKGKRLSDETKRRMSESKKGCLAWNKGISTSEEAKRKMSEIRKGRPSLNKGMKMSEESKRKMSISRKVLWNDSEFVSKMMKIWRIAPNKSELKLLEILQPLGFKFVGDGKYSVGGKLPDFWNGKNKLIELYGDYWHRNDDPQDRIDFFKEYGYDCLVIWEHELEDTTTIQSKIRNFCCGEE